MIYILNIGYKSYAFASSRGLQTVMDAMSKARELKHHYYQGCERECPEQLELSDGPVEIGMHCVQGVSFVSGGKRTRHGVIEPEVMPRVRPARTGRKPAAMQLKAAQYDLPQPEEWGRVTSGPSRKFLKGGE